MSDLAELGLRFQNENFDVTARQVDSFTEKVGKAEVAVDKAATTQKKLTAAQQGIAPAANTAAAAIVKQAEAVNALIAPMQQYDSHVQKHLEHAKQLLANQRYSAIAMREMRESMGQVSAGAVQLDRHMEAYRQRIASVGVGTVQLNSHMDAYRANAAKMLAAQRESAVAMNMLRGASMSLVGALGALASGFLIGAIITAVSAAIKFLTEKMGEAKRAIEASNAAYEASSTALDETRKYTDHASDSTLVFAGNLGTAAERALALAGANKEAAISSLMLARAQLGAANDNTQAQTTQGLWERANKKTWNIGEMIGGVGALFGAGASLFDTAGQDKLNLSIASNEAQMKKLEAEILRLNGLDLDAFTSRGTGAMKASEDAAKKAAAELARLRAEFRTLQESYDTREESSLRKIGVDMAKLDELAKKGLVSMREYVALAAKIVERPAALIAQKAFDPKVIENNAAKVGEAYSKAMEEAAEEARRSFNGALDDFEHGIRNRDWLTAFAGLFSAIKTLKKNWGEMNTGDRIGAVASIGQMAGSAIGGTAGSTISGAASGAMAGFTVAGPIGAAVGTVVGGIMGFLSGSKAKKAERAEQERQRLEQEAARAIEVANQGRTIEIQRLLLLGDATAARAIQLDAERSGIAESNRARFDEMVLLRDAQSIRELNIQLLEAQGRADEAQAMRRDDILKALIPAEQDLQRQIWATIDARNAEALAIAAADEARAIAKGIWDDKVRAADQAIADAERDLTAARNAETQVMREQAQQAAQTAQATRDTWKAFHDGLTEFERSLGAQMAGTGALSFRNASAQFNSNAVRARLGDTDAQAQFVSLGQTLAQSSAANAVTQIEHLRNLAGIRVQTEAARLTAGRQVSIAQQQLDAANAQIAALETVNESVLTVAQATANLAAALAVKANLTGVGRQANDNTAISFGSSQADIERLMATGLVNTDGPAASGPGFADLLLSQYYAGQLDPASGTYQNLKAQGFAGGGSGIVGGFGGPDSQYVPLALTPGELVEVSRPGDSGHADVVEAVNGLRGEVAQMRRDLGGKLDKGNSNTGFVATMLRTITRGEPHIYTKAA